MKNRYGNMSTSLVVVLFILSLLSGIVAAQTPGEQYDKDKEQYWMYKEKYDRTREKFEDAKKLFETANEKFKDAKDSKSKDELKFNTKEYLERAIDHTVAHLEVLKYRVELSENRGIFPFNASNNIDDHVAQLEQLRTKIQKANTKEELRDAHKELKDLWIKIRLETRYYFEIMLNHRINKFITRADNVSTRIDAAIEKLKAEGKDTTELEEEAASYKDLVKEAKDNQQKLSDLFTAHKGFSSDGTVINKDEASALVIQINDLQKETIKKLRAASRQLLDFVRDFRKLSGEKVVLNGTGRLEASGSGRALIKGNVTVILSGNATLIVSSNAEVTTVGTGTKEVLGNGKIKYQGFGSATIKGENIRVEISGNNIALTAEGTGSAVLTGKGTYRTEKDFEIEINGEWKKEN